MLTAKQARTDNPSSQETTTDNAVGVGAVNISDLSGAILIYPVETSIVIANNSDKLTDESFKKYFSNLYFDADREHFGEQLETRLRLLSNGNLRGQRNCFLVLGPHGIGKSQFLIAAGQWFVALAGQSGLFVYRNLKDVSVPFSPVVEPSLVGIIYHYVSHFTSWIQGDDNVCPWTDMHDCMKWLNAQHRRIFLVLDEFDELYKRPYIRSFLGDLYLIGESSGDRSIVVILSGSSAVLRPLCFCKLDGVSREAGNYPGYKDATSLNSQKFVPVSMGAIRSSTDLGKALAALRLSIVSEQEQRDMLMLTRGQVRLICDTQIGGRIEKAPVKSSIQEHEQILAIYLQYLFNHKESATLVVEVAAGEKELTDENLQSLSCPQSEFVQNLTLQALLDCMDASFLRDMSNGNYCIAHQSCLVDCFNFFGTRVVRLQRDSPLSLEEKICLLYANNAGTDEINEALVAESLCEHGLDVPNIGYLRFRMGPNNALQALATGVTRDTKHNRHVKHGACRLLWDINSLGVIDLTFKKRIVGSQNKPAQLFKEYPDETGADLIGAFELKKPFGRQKRWVVIRIQIKLGLSTTFVHSEDKTAIEWMKRHESMLLSGMGITAENVTFVTVLWTSRPTKSESNVANHVLVIKSSEMRWVKRLQDFVSSEQITSYGYTAW